MAALPPYFDSVGPRVLAHRGLALDAPENSLLAFERARAIGITHIETDVHASADGVAVIAHDADLERIVGRPEAVASLTAAELRGLDLGGGEGMPSLAEALHAFPDAFFNIDIKSAAAVGPTVDTILDQRARDRVLLTSFSERRRRAAVQRIPGVATSASGPRFATALLLTLLRGGPGVTRALSGLHAMQIPARALGLDTTAPARVQAFHDAGVEVHVWTINDAATMRTLLDRGVDGLVTDRADIALEVISTLT